MKATERIVNQIIVFVSFYMALKNESAKIQKLRSDGC